MNEYQKTEWVFDNGDCEGCSQLLVDPGDHHNPAWNSCQVLDNFNRYSDRCPRLEQYDAALSVAIEKAPINEILSEEYERFLPMLSEIVREKQVDRAYDIMAEFDRAAREYAEATL